MGTKIKKQCRICGKMFTPCADCEKDKKIFRWRKVACSPICAKKYFKKIEETRQLKFINIENKIVTQNTTEKSDVAVDINNKYEERKQKKIKKRNIIENKESEQIE